MPMDVFLDDLYELVDEQTSNGQQVFNVYFYRTGALFVTTTPTNAQVLAENWADQILPDLIGVQSDQVTHNRVSVRNLYDPADSFAADISVPGFVVSAEVLPNFNAYPFKLAPDTAAVGQGAKRLAGVPEAAQQNGVVTDGLTLTRLATASAAMEAAVQVGLILPSDVFFPAIVKRVRTGVSGSYEYSLPTVRGTGVWANVLSALFDVLLTSQVSRKIGVGI